MNYLYEHSNKNNHITKIAKGIGTTSQTATKYLYYYWGAGFIYSEDIINVTLFYITEKGIERLNKIKEVEVWKE